MSRTLALVLLLGAACFSALAADPAPGVPATGPVKAADPVQAPVPAPATTPVSKEAPASTPVQAESKNKGKGGTQDVANLWAGAYCCATLTVNGQSQNLFNPTEIPMTTPPGSIFVPPVADNAPTPTSLGTNCITMGSINNNIYWATEFFDRNQVLIVTLEFDANGKLTLSYMVNSRSHHAKMDLHKAQIQITCDSFENVVGFLPDHKKTNFPHEVKSTWSKPSNTLILDIHPLKTEHHCSLHKAVWMAALCQKSDGPCCQNGRFVAGGRSHICRKSNSPCVQDAYCDGVTAKCLQAAFEPENKACGWNARHGQLYSASIQHTRLPQSSAVSIASVTGKPTSYEDLEQCTGKCQGGTCVILPNEGCCKESSYGYYGYEDEYTSNDYYDSYGKDDYDKYGKDDYEKYGKYDDKYGKDDYDKYGKKDDDYGKYGKKEDDYDKYGKRDDDYGKHDKKDSYAAIASANDNTNTGNMISCFTGNPTRK